MFSSLNNLNQILMLSSSHQFLKLKSPDCIGEFNQVHCCSIIFLYSPIDENFNFSNLFLRSSCDENSWFSGRVPLYGIQFDANNGTPIAQDSMYLILLLHLLNSFSCSGAMIACSPRLYKEDGYYRIGTQPWHSIFPFSISSFN